jgi:hypothetical protein
MLDGDSEDVSGRGFSWFESPIKECVVLRCVPFHRLEEARLADSDSPSRELVSTADASRHRARELNPVELIWGYAKAHRLANFAPLELHDLVMQTQLAIYAIGDDQSLLRSFIQHCSLSLRLK